VPPTGNLGALIDSDLRPVRPPPLPRAWHVYRANGGAETVVAHYCLVVGGAIGFYNHLDPDDSILVRAFGPREWDEAELIDTPYATAVHLPPHVSLIDARV